MRHIRWQVLIAVIGIALISAAVSFLALTTDSVEQPDFGGTYVEGIVGKPSALNPLFANNDIDRDIAALVFSGLTRADETGAIRPDLATRWTISPDGLVYTFSLRSDVRWHDGARFSADDVLLTIHLIQDPAFKGPGDLAAFWRTVAISKIDSATVRFQLTQPYAPFLYYTTIGILPAHVLQDVPPAELLQNPFNRRPIGTGPFQVAELSSDSVLLDANTRYYGTRPFLARVQFKFFPDYDAIFSTYLRGEVQGISRVLPGNLTKARALNSLKMYNARLAGYTLVYLNLSKAPFQDRQVRQALLYALDRPRLIDELMLGQGLIANSPIAPESWAFDSAVNPFSYDAEKAKAMLDQAGWKDASGEGVRKKDQTALAFTLHTNDDPSRIVLANEIARAWQAIGVKANVQAVPAAQLAQNILRARQFDAVLSEWRTLSSDPDQYENWHQTQIASPATNGQNYSGLNDRDISEALEAARRTNDQAKRADLYRRFQELFAEREPALVLFYPVYTFAIDSRVRGVQVAPMFAASDRFRNIAQWYLKTKRVTTSFSPIQRRTPTPDNGD